MKASIVYDSIVQCSTYPQVENKLCTGTKIQQSGIDRLQRGLLPLGSLQWWSQNIPEMLDSNQSHCYKQIIGIYLGSSSFLGFIQQASSKP